MDVVGHDHEFVEKEFLLIAIIRQGVDQESRGCVTAKDRKALSGDGSDEEDAVGVHFEWSCG